MQFERELAAFDFSAPHGSGEAPRSGVGSARRLEIAAMVVVVIALIAWTLLQQP